MNQEIFQTWLDLYGKAWMNRDRTLIADLFAENATYHEKPFDSPMQGIRVIEEYWDMVSKTQDDVKFDYEILDVTKELGIAHWQASFFRKSQNIIVKLDGILIATLNSENKCTSFREWWQSNKINQE